MIEAMLARIPYLEPHALELEAASPEVVRVRQPFRHALKNIVGTMHAGALFTVAETAAGVAAFLVAAEKQPMVLLRTATVHYARRVQGDVTATAEIDAAAADTAREAFASSGRGSVTVHVQLADDSGTEVFSGAFEYAIREQPK